MLLYLLLIALVAMALGWRYTLVYLELLDTALVAGKEQDPKRQARNVEYWLRH